MSELVHYDRRPEDISKEIAETFSAIAEISGKSIQSLYRSISLLKLPDEIQTAIRQETSLFHGGISSLPTSIVPIL